MLARGPSDAPAVDDAPSAGDGRADATPADGDRRVDRLLEQVEAPGPVATTGTAAVSAGLRAARVLTVGHGAAMIAWRGSSEPLAAEIAAGVEIALLEEIAAQGGSVLVEDGPPPIVVGVLQTCRPRDLKLRGKTIEIEAESEVLLRTGRAAVRLREDGDIEIVGGRIHAASRGLFRLVGRVLRLN